MPRSNRFPFRHGETIQTTLMFVIMFVSMMFIPLAIMFKLKPLSEDHPLYENVPKMNWSTIAGAWLSMIFVSVVLEELKKIEQQITEYLEGILNAHPHQTRTCVLQ